MAALSKNNQLDQVFEDFPEFDHAQYLGGGSNGDVFRVNKGPNHFALKIIKNKEMSSVENHDHFTREVVSMACLNHPHIVRLIDGGIRNKRTKYLLTEFIEGETLEERIEKEGALSHFHFAKVILQLMSSLNELHRHGFIHRDVKPANLMLRSDFSLKLIDFGLVTRQAKKNPEIEKQSVGTLQYAAPEQLGLVSMPVDFSSDYFSVGLLAYECATGQRFIQGSHPSEILESHLGSQSPSLNTQSSLWPIELSRWIESLCAKDPLDRFSSGDHLMSVFNQSVLPKLRLSSDERAQLAGSNFSSHLSEVVGRTEEVQKISNFLELGGLKNQHLMFVRGSPGIGKSALISEALRTSAESYFSLSEKFTEFDQNPFGAMGRIWSRYLSSLKVLQSEEREPLERHLSACLAKNGEALLKLNPAFSDFVQVSSNDLEYSDDQLILIVSDFIIRFMKTAPRPILFYFDRFEYAQGLAQETFRILIKEVHQGRSKILISGSDGPNEVDKELSDIMESLEQSQIQLEPLPASELEELLFQRAGSRALPAELIRPTVELSKGNPFEAIQLFTHFLDRGAVFLNHGAWEVDREKLLRIELPSNLKDLMSLQFEKISPLGVEALKFAALLGEEFSVEVVAELLGQEFIPIMIEMSDPLRLGLVLGTAGEKMTFVHERVRQSILEKMASKEFKELHKSIADWHATHEPENIRAHAFHLLEAGSPGDSKEICSIYFEAGLQAVKGYSTGEAIRFFEASLRLIREENLQVSNKARILAELGRSHKLMGTPEEGLAYLEEALALEKDSIERVRILEDLVAYYLFLKIDFQKAGELIHQSGQELGYEYFDEKRIEAWLLVKNLFLILFHFAFGKYFPLSRENSVREKAALKTGRMAVVLSYVGNKKFSVIAHIPLFVRLGLRVGTCRESISAFCLAMLGLGVLRQKNGVRWIAKRVIQMSGQIGDPFLLTQTKIECGIAHIFSGQEELGETLLRDLIQNEYKWMTAEDQARAFNNLSIIYTAKGKLKELCELNQLRNIAEVDSDERLSKEGREVASEAGGFFENAMLGQSSEALGQLSKITQLLKEDRVSPQIFGLVSIFVFLGLAELKDFQEAEASANDLVLRAKKFGMAVRRTPFYQKPYFLGVSSFYAYRFLKCPSPEALERLREATLAFRKIARTPLFRVHLEVHELILLFGERRWSLFEKRVKSVETFLQQVENQLAKYMFYTICSLFENERGRFDKALSNRFLALQIAKNMGWLERVRSLSGEFDGRIQSSPESFGIGSFQPFEALNQSRVSEALLRVTVAASHSLDPQEQAQLALAEILDLLHAEKGYLFSYNRDEDRFVVKSGRSGKSGELKELNGYSQTFIQRLVSEKRPLRLLVGADGEVSRSESIIANDLKSIIAVPMFLRGELVGAAYFDSSIVRGLFSEDDFQLCQAICTQVAVAQEMARMASLNAVRVSMERDLELTAAVQGLFFPQKAHVQEKNLEFFGFYRPSTHCSGDWWWHEIAQNGRVRIIALDVTGHGSAAAMVTSALATLIRGGNLTREFPKFLFDLDHQLSNLVRGAYCATLTCLEIDPVAGEFEFWSAGAPPILHFNKDGEGLAHQAEGSLLGQAGEDVRFKCVKGKLQDGDRLYIFSDGLFEIPMAPGKRHNFKNLYKMLKKERRSSIEDSTLELVNELVSFTDRLDELDDMTLISIEFRKKA